MSRQNRMLAIGIVGLFLPATGPALAASYGTGADVGGVGTCSYTGCYGYGYDSLNPSYNFNATSSSSTSPLSSSANGSGNGSLSNGSSWSTAGIGDLHAYATATAHYPPDPSTAATGEAHARAYWNDTLTITSNTWAPGTTVDLIGNLHLDGNLSISNSTALSDNVNGDFSLSWRSNLQPYVYYGGADCKAGISGGYIGTYPNGTYGLVASGSLPCDSPFTIHTAVGDKIAINGSLSVQAYARAGVNGTYPPYDPFPSSTATADFSNTGFISLQSPSGVMFVADSGASYASPVPLPAAVWLFDSGLLGLIGVARRKKIA